MKFADALVGVRPGAAEVRAVPVIGNAPGGTGTVLAAGVCGTDVGLFLGSELSRRVGPLVFGHENVVRIDALDAASAERWAVREGDRVLVEEYVPCGHCARCRAGSYRICRDTDFNEPRFLRYGRMGADVPGPWGGLGELLYLHPNARLHRLPDGLAAHLAALAVPLANAHRWLTRVARVPVGGTVAVIGPGAIGLCSVVVAREAGAANVVLAGTGSDQRRLRIGTGLGASLASAAEPGEVTRQVRLLTGGAMADVVLDATGGASSALELAGELAGFGADVILAGTAAERPAVSLLRAAAQREVSVRGVRGHDGISLDYALGLLARNPQPFLPLLSPAAPLEDAAEVLRWLASPDPDRPIHISITTRGAEPQL